MATYRLHSLKRRENAQHTHTIRAKLIVGTPGAELFSSESKTRRFQLVDHHNVTNGRHKTRHSRRPISRGRFAFGDCWSLFRENKHAALSRDAVDDDNPRVRSEIANEISKSWLTAMNLTSHPFAIRFMTELIWRINIEIFQIAMRATSHPTLIPLSRPTDYSAVYSLELLRHDGLICQFFNNNASAWDIFSMIWDFRRDEKSKYSRVTRRMRDISL